MSEKETMRYECMAELTAKTAAYKARPITSITTLPMSSLGSEGEYVRYMPVPMPRGMREQLSAHQHTLDACGRPSTPFLVL